MRFLVVALALSTLMFSCTERKVQNTKHEQEAPKSAEDKKADFQFTPEAREFDRQLNANQSPGALLSSTKSLLSPENLSNPSFLGSTASVQKLSVLNKTILNSWDNAASADLKNYYLQQILAGCDAQLNNCTHLGFFKKDENSSRILQKMAAAETELTKKYQLLMVAYEIKNVSEDKELDSLYLDKAAEFEKTLTSETKTELLQRHRRIVGLILQKAQNKDIRTDGAQAYGDWKIKSTGHALAPNMRNLLTVLSRSKLYSDKSKTALHADFIKSINEIQNESGSYKLKINQVKEQIPASIKQLNVTPLDKYDEYFYMVDRVFSGDISAQEMLVVFENSTGDLKKLSDVARKYIEGQLLSLVYESNTAMAARLNDSDVYANKIWFESYRASDSISQKVLTFLRKNDDVRSFIEAAHQKQSLSPDKELISFFTSIRPNLKMILTYPQMLSVGYLMAERNFQGVIETFWGSYTISPSTIMTVLFEGYYKPWFQYGHDEEKLSSSDILVAMEFALKTQAFKVFNIPVEKFYNMIFSTLLSKHHLELQESLTSLTNTYKDSAWTSLQKICSYLPGQPKVPMSFSIDTLREYPTGEISRKFGETFYPYDANFNTKLLVVEFIQKPIQRRLVALNQSLQTFLKESGESEEEISKKSTLTMAPVRELQKTQDKFIAELLRVEKQFDNCFSEYARYNQDMKQTLLSYEAEYLREIHALMKQARSTQDKNELEKLNEKARFYKVAGFPTFQSFKGDSFLYYYPDFYLRLKYYVEKGLKTSTKDLPAVQPYFKIQLGENAKSSTAMQYERFEQVYWNDNVEVFVSNAMRVLNLGKVQNRALEWYDTNVAYNFRKQNASAWMWSASLSYLYNISSIGEGEPQSLELNEILNYGERLDRAFSISPNEEKWRIYVGARDKLMYNMIQESLIDVDDNHTLAPFEYLVKNFAEPNRGPSHLAVVPFDPPSLYEEAQNFYLESNQPKQFTFNTKFGFYEKLTEIYKKEIQRMDVRAKAFVEGLQEKYNSDVANNKVLTPSFSFGSRYSGPYASEASIKSLKSRNTIFHQNTNNAFKK